MGREQKLVVAVGASLFIVAGAFPPWRFVRGYPNPESVSTPATYAWILSPPASEDKRFIGVRVDLERLAVEWVVLGTTTMAVVMLLRRDRRPPTRTAPGVLFSLLAMATNDNNFRWFCRILTLLDLDPNQQQRLYSKFKAVTAERGSVSAEELIELAYPGEVADGKWEGTRGNPKPGGTNQK